MPVKPKAVETKEVIIPAIQLGRMVVKIRGLTGLIQNRFREESIAAMEAKQQGAAKMTKAPRKPEEEFRGALHVMPDGKYGFPAVGIKKALVAAGGRFADGTMTILRGVVNIPTDLIEIKSGEPPFMRRDAVVIQGGGGIAYRPEFRKWEMDVPVIFMSNMITEAQVYNLFQLAGFAVGIGSWRPEKSGTHGQFELVEG